MTQAQLVLLAMAPMGLLLCAAAYFVGLDAVLDAFKQRGV